MTTNKEQLAGTGINLLPVSSLELVNKSFREDYTPPKTRKAAGSNKPITRTQAKAVHKELPPGGVWRTINGHHIYIKDGKVLAGAIPGVTGAKKATKAHLAEHQNTIDAETKKGAKKDAKSTKKPSSSSSVRSRAGRSSGDASNKPAAKSGRGTKATKPAGSKKDKPALVVEDSKGAGKDGKVRSTGRGASKRNKPDAGDSTGRNKAAATTVETRKRGNGGSKDGVQTGAGKKRGSAVSAAQQPRKADKPAAKGKKATESSQAAGKSKPKSKQVATPSAETMESTRKFTARKAYEWFRSLPSKEQKTIMGMETPESSYKVGVPPAGMAMKDAQHVLDAFHHLRAQSGLSKEKAGKDTSKKGVKDTRHKAQDNKAISYDVGEKVGGARKDLATLSQRFEANPSAQDLEALEQEFPEAAQKLCTKKNLLKPMDWETERDSGVDINTAMAKKLVYDRIATEPAGNDPLNRLLYFNAIQNIQRVLEPIKTWDEFKDATRELGNYMRKETPRELQYAEASAKRAVETLSADSPREYDLTQYGASYDRDKGKWNIPKGAKDKWRADQQKRVAETIERLATTKAANMAPMGLPLGEKFHNFFTDYESRNRTYSTIQSKRLTWDKYFEEKGNKASKTSEGGEKERTLRPGEERARIPVKDAKRVGGKKVSVSKPEDMVSAYNFRGVEFGNYVNDEDGKHHLSKASEAFSDLADVLGLHPKDVSLNGRLAMSFGARGKGGALAHYEPVSKVINMTRDAGAGTLAHEWGHALDNILHAESTGKPSIGFASDSIGSEGSPEVREAYEGLLDAINRGDGKEYVKPDGKSYQIPYRWKDLHEMPFNDAFKKVREDIDKAYERQIDMNERYHRNATDLKAGLEKARALHDKTLLNSYHALAHLFSKNGKSVPDFERSTNMSQFLTEANALCKGKQGYWNRKHELFARAFESYVLDKLGGSNRRNDYLVAGTTNPRVYPQGKERELFNKHFDKLMEAVRNSGAIKKGLSIDLQRGITLFDKLAEMFYLPDKRGEAKEFMRGVWGSSAERLAKLQARRDPEGIESAITERNAYDIDHETDPSEVIYIPVNRLRMVYQTDEATNWDKVKENMDKMRAGGGLKPVEIGYDYDVHDGHHRWIASKELDYTHVPCIVKGKDEAERQEAIARYREIWKSLDWEDTFQKALVEYDYDVGHARKAALIEFQKSMGVLERNAEYQRLHSKPFYKEFLDRYEYHASNSGNREEAFNYAADEMELEGDDTDYLHGWLNAMGQSIPASALRKAVVIDPVAEHSPFAEAQPHPYPGGDRDYMMYRGVGQKELDFIQKHGFIQSKGKGNDDDKGSTDTCFTQLWQQAEGYARWNYVEYEESAAYVLVVPRPPWVYEDEHGELISDRPVPFDIGAAVFIPNPDDERTVV